MSDSLQCLQQGPMSKVDRDNKGADEGADGSGSPLRQQQV
jgi:hypothetical protein